MVYDRNFLLSQPLWQTNEHDAFNVQSWECENGSYGHQMTKTAWHADVFLLLDVVPLPKVRTSHSSRLNDWWACPQCQQTFSDCRYCYEY